MESTRLERSTIEAMLDLARLALAFGRVDRITCHPDGTTFESDTDHTVMLGLVACSFAERFAPALDRGLVAQFALVHDLVEVYAGDTPTAFIMTDGDHSSKEERETLALARIREEFDGELPWIGETIARYETLDTPEARYVKVMDKSLPKMVNIFNGGVTFKAQGHDAASGQAFLTHQHAKIAGGYGKDQKAAMILLEALGEEMMREIF
jgi:5'-deoxynucleotidase YfbR-like HD superfamily hydrolase